MTDMTIPGDARPAAVCPKCGWRCSAGGTFRSNTTACPTIGCAGQLVLDPLACARSVATACWPDREWDVQIVTSQVRFDGRDLVQTSYRPYGARPDGSGCLELDLTSFRVIDVLEGVAIERGLERVYGAMLFEELPRVSSEFTHAGVQWARAPLDARIRALHRAFEWQAEKEARAEDQAEQRDLERQSTEGLDA